jgi:hypothetical protein
VHQQVVDAPGAPALEVVLRRHDAELLLEAQQVLPQRGDEAGLDRVLEDREAVPLDPLKRVCEVQSQTPF